MPAIESVAMVFTLDLVSFNLFLKVVCLTIGDVIDGTEFSLHWSGEKLKHELPDSS